MNSILFLMMVILIIALCFVNIPAKVYQSIRWSIIFVVISTSVLILNDVIPHLWIMSFVEMVQLNDIGNPEQWINSSLVYREYIKSLYYLVIIGSMAMFLINLLYKDKYLGMIIKMSFFKNIIATAITFLLLYVLFFTFGSSEIILTKKELLKNKAISIYLNTIWGFLILHISILFISELSAKYVKWLVWFFRSKMNRSINVNQGDSSE